MDKTDRINFSFSFDLDSQNKVLKDPGQVYIVKAINDGRFFVDFWPILARFWDILGIIWG